MVKINSLFLTVPLLSWLAISAQPASGELHNNHGASKIHSTLTGHPAYYVEGLGGSGGGAISGATTVCVGATITLTDTATGGSWTSGTTSAATVSADGVVSGIATGTSIISYTNESGSSTITITVLTVPAPADISGPSAVCTGGITSYTDPTPGGVWSSSSPAIFISSSGLAAAIGSGSSIISYTVTNACGTGAVSQSVTIDNMPTVSEISAPTAICSGSSSLLTDASTGGTWTVSGPATISSSGVLFSLAPGTANVSYIITNSCSSASASATIAIDSVPVAGTLTGPPDVCPGATIATTASISGGSYSASNLTMASVSATGLVSGLIPGSDTIIYTISNSCGAASVLLPVTIDTLSNAGAITGASTVCAGSSISLTDMTAGGTWSSGDASIATVNSAGSVNGVSAGTATISYTAANGCGSASATIAITVTGAPSASDITGPSQICTGNTATLSAAISGGVWASSEESVLYVSADGVINGVTPGMAYARYTVTNSCGSTTTAYADTVLSTTACTALVENVMEPATWSLSPNPCHGQLNIELPATYGTCNIWIADMTGRTVMSKEISGTSSLDVSTLNEGNYVVIITGQNIRDIKKITLN